MARKQPAFNVMQALASAKWAMRPQALETLMRIASRSNDELRVEYQAILAERGAPLDHTSYAELRDGVAILRVTGPMCRYASWFADVSGLTSYEVLATDFTRVLKDSSARAIVFQLDTPGGEVSGCAELGDLVYRARGTKPIIAVCSDMAASAGYWLASACDEIVVTPAAETGCIGVMCQVSDWSEADKRYGVETYTLVSEQTPNKLPDVRTEAGRAQITQNLNSLAQVFLDAIGTHLGVTSAEALTIAGEGRIFIGAEGVTRGLAHRVATTEAVLAELAAGNYAQPDRAQFAGAIRTRVAAAARAVPRSSTTQEPTMPPKKAADPAPKKRAIANGDEVKVLVTRDASVKEGDTGKVTAVREAVTIVAIDSNGKDKRWLIADEEVEVTSEAPAGEPVDPPPAVDPPAAGATVDPAPAPAAFKTAAEFAAAHPTLAAELRAEGATAENARAAKIRAMAPSGCEAIADTCVADLAMTPETAATHFLQAQKTGAVDHLRAMRSAEANAPKLAPLASGDLDQTEQSAAKRAVADYQASRPRPARG